MSGSLSPPSLSYLERLPAELAERVIDHLTLQERLVLRKVSRRWNAMIVPRTPALCPPLNARFELLRLHKLSGVLHVSSLGVDLPTAQHLVPLMEHTVAAWKRKVDEEKVDCFATFRFPPRTQFSLFDTASAPTIIGHLQIAQQLPVYLDGKNLKRIRRLLDGCAVEKTTLVFDQQTLTNLPKVPCFLRSLSCRRIEFALEKTHIQDMLKQFGDASLARSLVSSGVDEISFSGVPAFGRLQPRGHETSREEWNGYNMRRFFESVLSVLFTAGIKTIVIGKGTLVNDRMSLTKLDKLIDNLHSLGRPLRLCIELAARIDNLAAGRYETLDDEEANRRVEVEADVDGVTWQQRITIVYRGVDETV